MANYADVKAIIDTYIKRNGIKAITGNILNGVLNAMLNELGAGYQYGGMAVPATDPGAPDYNVVYLAATAGTYTDFDGITLAEGEIALLKYNGSWAKETVGSFYSRTDIDTMLEDYVQKEPGKGLSTNDYTDDDKAKLDGIEPGAQVNVIEGVSVNGYRLQPDHNKVVDVDVPTDLSKLREDAEHRLVTDDQIAGWNAKYDKPAGGIPAEDLAQAVQDLLTLAGSSLQPSDIVQETGEQTDKVMSQKAVTDAIKEGAGKDGYYPGLIAGNADALMGRPSNAEILFAPYPGASGNALIQSIYGKTVAWNQLLQNGDFSDGTTGWIAANSTMVVNDGVCTFTPTGAYGLIYHRVKIINGHLYYFAATINTAGTVRMQVRNTTKSTAPCDYIAPANGRNSTIFTAAGVDATDFVVVRIVENNTAGHPAVSVDNIILIDLTLLTGITTVAEFEKFYNRPYYAFNAGTLLNNKAAAIESRGFNQWDEQWESGYYNVNTGEPAQNENHIRSKANDPIPVFPSTSYYTYFGGATSSSRVLVFFYDAGMNFISRTSGAGGTNVVWTTPSNCRYVRFYVELNTIYNHNICINFSDTARNGEYEPYTLTTLHLDLTTLTGKLNGEGESVVIAPDGLRSAGTAHDVGIVENGYLTKIIKIIGTANLGDLTYSYDAGGRRFTGDGFSGNVADGTVVPNAISERYTAVKGTDTYTAGDVRNKTFGFSATEGRIFIRDFDFTDASVLKAALSGVKLAFELAEPQTYVLDTPIPVTYAVENGGTERILPDGVDLQGVPATAPFPFQRRFPIDIIDDVTKPMLDAAVTAGVIAGYTVTWNEATGQFDFTFTAPTNRSVSLGNPFAKADTDTEEKDEEMEKKTDVEATEDIGETAYTEAETKAELTK